MNSWLLLRGLTRDARHWDTFPDHLRAAFPGVPVATADLPGNGARHREASPASVAAMVADVRRSVDALDLPRPTGVVALSLGAMVTAAWATARPQDLGAAVLIGTSLRPFSPWVARLRPTAWPDVLRAAWATAPERADAAEAAVWRLTSRRPEADRDAVVRQWADWRRAAPVTAANGLRQLWAAARHRAATTRPGVPLLLLAGAGDALVHPGCSSRLARAWDVPFHLHPWAGHDVPLDDPDWVVATIRDWTATLDTPARTGPVPPKAA